MQWCTLLSSAETGESILTIKGPQGRINRAVWGPLNKTIISGGEDSVIRIWDSEVMTLFYGPIKRKSLLCMLYLVSGNK